jgi:hypothetical protein
MGNKRVAVARKNTRVTQRVCFQGDAFAAPASRRAFFAELELRRKEWRTEVRFCRPRTLLFTAHRPAGTREALPGTMSRGLRPAEDSKTKYLRRTEATA